jgi:hypothetical protein
MVPAGKEDQIRVPAMGRWREAPGPVARPRPRILIWFRGVSDRPRHASIEDLRQAVQTLVLGVERPES